MAVEAEEAFTAAAVVVADFMGAAGFTAEEDSPADTLDLVAAARSAAGITAAITVDAAAMDGAAEVGAADMVTVGAAGAGDLALAGLIGDMDGDIRMAITAIRITRPHIRILPTDILRIT